MAFADARVLVVDDNDASVNLLTSLLTRAGIRSVEAVRDPRVALDRVTDYQPDLVLLDLHMPGLTGFKVLEVLRHRASPTELPVLVLTADTSTEATRRALHLGANDFLTKPLDTTEVTLRVRNLLDTQAAHNDLRHRQDWLEASIRIARALFAEELPNPLPAIADVVCRLAQADLVVTSLAGSDDPEVQVPAQVGEATNRIWLTAQALRVSERLGPEVSRSGRASVFDARDRIGGGDAVDHGGAAFSSVMVIPLVGMEVTRGTLTVFRLEGRKPFTTWELDIASGFVNRSAMALELADRRLDHQRFLVLQDRHRVARALHDTVIQRLFAIGIGFQAIASRIGPGTVADQIVERVAELDTTIAHIRDQVLQLGEPLTVPPGTLQLRVRYAVTETLSGTSLEPVLRFSAVPELEVSESLADATVDAVREALSNVVRHADAQHVEVCLALSDRGVHLEVVDDGRGVGKVHFGTGLLAMSESAERLGGDLVVEPSDKGGTRLIWATRNREPHALLTS